MTAIKILLIIFVLITLSFQTGGILLLWARRGWRMMMRESLVRRRLEGMGLTSKINTLSHSLHQHALFVDISTRLPSIPIYQDHVFCAAKSVVQFHLHS